MTPGVIFPVSFCKDFMKNKNIKKERFANVNPHKKILNLIKDLQALIKSVAALDEFQDTRNIKR